MNTRYNKNKPIINEACKQAVIFARVSSEEQERGASLSAQLQAIKDYCETRSPKLNIIKTFSFVESSTRGVRKKFNEMLDFVKKQKHKTALIVHCIDRMQRGYKECVEIDQLRTDDKIEVHFYKEGFYLHKDSPSTDIMRWDMGVLSAKMYVGSLRDNVIRSQTYKWETEGQWQSVAPVGYLNISKTKTTKAQIIIDEERAPKVKRLFEEYAKDGRTLQDITNFARDLDLCSKHCTKNTTISRVQVYQILQNTYLKCNHLKNNCKQKPVNEQKLFAQIEAQLCNGIKLTDSMLEALKIAVREKNLKKILK